MRPVRLTAVLLVLALGGAAAADAERVQEGNVVVVFGGGISPRVLPRNDAAPVTVGIETAIKATDGGDPPPQLHEIAIAINREGRLFDRGLPTCRVRSIQPATIRAARQICGGAIVGSGHVRLRVHLPNQTPFGFEGPMLAFNAQPSGGKRRILAQVYGNRPRSAFVLTFTVVRTKGEFGTLIRTTLPRSVRRWAYVTEFEMKLRRIYTYRGERRSYLNASCPAPPGFTTAVFPFARGIFTFPGGRRVVSTLTRTCRVRGPVPARP